MVACDTFESTWCGSWSIAVTAGATVAAAAVAPATDAGATAAANSAAAVAADWLTKSIHNWQDYYLSRGQYV